MDGQTQLQPRILKMPYKNLDLNQAKVIIKKGGDNLIVPYPKHPNPDLRGLHHHMYWDSKRANTIGLAYTRRSGEQVFREYYTDSGNGWQLIGRGQNSAPTVREFNRISQNNVQDRAFNRQITQSDKLREPAAKLIPPKNNTEKKTYADQKTQQVKAPTVQKTTAANVSKASRKVQSTKTQPQQKLQQSPKQSLTSPQQAAAPNSKPATPKKATQPNKSQPTKTQPTKPKVTKTQPSKSSSVQPKRSVGTQRPIAPKSPGRNISPSR